MAKKKAIVITNGQLEQLQAGDQLDIGNSVTRENANAGTITIGQPVYATNATDVDLARANAQATIRVTGLVQDVSVATGAPADILTDGILTATTGQWDAVTGQVGGLTPNADYFLDPAVAGRLTTVAPTTAGQFVLRVGHALSPTEFEIEVQQPVKL
jgi:hypothetical protein